MAPRKNQPRVDAREVDEILEDLLVDAYGESEQLCALCEGISEALELPIEAQVVGVPVSLRALDYEDARRRLVVRCRRSDGSEHQVDFADVALPADAPGAPYLAAYCAWLGVEPKLATPTAAARKANSNGEPELDLTKPVDLVVLRVKERALRCRIVDGEAVITLRAGSRYGVAAGQIVTVKPAKQWRFKGHPYLSGETVGTRVDAAALGLTPLRLDPCGPWDPAEHDWGEDDEPVNDHLEAVRAAGPRPMFEMEQILPGADPAEPFDDPILRAREFEALGDRAAAEDLLAEVLEADLRCLDAHAHLGNRQFPTSPAWALSHYEVGVQIGDLSLGPDSGEPPVLPWGLIDNRPWLRCMLGQGLCLWRLERWEEAERVFERMLWLNPTDNQGVRFLTDDVAKRKPWTNDDS
ncbi:MAG: cytoplasmic protein [Sandaracinus sp.]|nr:cytoplasmic protein [Sandaracinus sp.]|tara:strand:+ start:652 stop:1881 length:1230 start_codon:yes stop_codon:yes gene_type:complete